MKKRNIVFFHAESWDGRMLGGLGHPALKDATPNIDRVARDGMFFPNTYTSHPLCCPARANLWSGRYTHNCESWNNYKGLEPRMWSLLDELPRTHNLATFGKLDYRSGGHSMQARVSAWLGRANINRSSYADDNAQDFSVAGDAEERCHKSDWDKIDKSIAFLEEQKKDESDRPFFLYVSTGLVHPSFKTNRYWLEKIPEEAVDIPEKDDCDHPCIKFQRNSKSWRYGFDDDTVRQVRRIYFAMCAEADAMAGKVYEAMHRLGLAEDTYFIFSSDHGELALEHRQYYKMSMYEASIRVPMIMTGPGIPAGGRTDNLVSLIDLHPTMLEMGGMKGHGDCDGESLLPLATGKTEQSRNSAYAMFSGTTMNTSAFMLRKDNWKYIAYVNYPPQLFDIEKDPGELNDLSEQKPEIVREMDAELRDIVDYEKTDRDVTAYCKESFRQWRRQAKRGLYVDNSYSLQNNPSSDYWKIMDNCFAGYNGDDEAGIEKWLG
ncbi:MAG: sulfatase-like hydrolase/transferase [Kiritimatiellia bacterium]